MIKDNHILPFLWMRGEDEAVLREEMEKIDEAGIGAVCIEARPHPDFAGPQWWHDVDIILDEAKKRDMKIWILDDAHFPTGNANGAMAEHPEAARRFVYTQFVDVTGPMPYANVDVDLLTTKRVTWMDLGKPVVEPLLDETRLLSVVAAKVAEGDTLTGELVDLTAQVTDGILTFDVPEGTWRIFVSFATTAFGANPDRINYIDHDSVRVQIDAVYEPHFEHYADEFGKTILGFFSDEPGFYNIDSFGSQNYVGLDMPLPWGAEMEELFSAAVGEGWSAKLPLLFAPCVDGREEQLRYTYMDLVSHLYSKNFCCQLGDWCHEHGVEYIGHIVEDSSGHMRLGAGVGHYFRAMKGQDVAGIDNIGYQLMPGNENADRHTGFQDLCGRFYHYEIAKLASSAAAIDPNKRGRVLIEDFGAYGWRLGPRDMKWIADFHLSQGVNMFVPHAFSMAEYPDMDCPPHFYARGNNPQFPAFCKLMKYVNRMADQLSGGSAVTPAAVLYEADADWSCPGEDSSRTAQALLSSQIDFTYVPADSFRDGEVAVMDGGLCINGRTMQVLVVPQKEFIPQVVADFILANPELPVVFVGQYPEFVCGSGSQKAPSFETRPVVPVADLAAQLRAMGVGDGAVSVEADADLRVYHYQNPADVLFFMNTSLSRTVDVCAKVNIGGDLYVYDAMDQKTFEAPVADGELCFSLAPYESLLVVTEPMGDVLPVPARPTGEKGIELADFDVTLHEMCKDEAEPLGMEALVPVSAVRPTFSGSIEYVTTFELDEVPAAAELACEHVGENLMVTVNGQDAALVVAPPYVADIAPYLQEGENEIVLTVLTTPLRNANTFPCIFGPERTVLEPTGLFGSVRILTA